MTKKRVSKKPKPRRAKASITRKVEGSPQEERRKGEVPYLEILKKLHSQLAPKRYLEIGVRRGISLALARGKAVGVDPQPLINVKLSRATRLFRTTSDRFFAKKAIDKVGGRPDLVFIDGMHHFEFALRDFMNAEAIAPPHGLIVMDDIYPNHPAQAARKRRTSAWTGDVWKVHEVLRKYRRDLLLLPLDTAPTGLLLVAGLDPTSTVLKRNYRALLNAYRTDRNPPRSVISRRDKVSPKSPELRRLLLNLRAVRRRALRPADLRAKLRHSPAQAPGR